MRARVRAPDHRLLLALLLNLPDRAAIDAMLRQSRPDCLPEACVSQWLAEIAAQWTGDRAGPFGAPLDDTGRAVLDGLLRGMTDSEVFDRLLHGRDDVTDAQMAAIFDLCHTFRTSPLLARLLA